MAPIVRAAHLVRYAVLAGAGALLAAACTHTAGWWWALLAVALLVMHLERLPPGRWQQGALAGLVFSAAWIASAVWWLFISMHRYGGLPAPLAAAAVGVLALALGVYLAAACAAYVRWRLGRPGPDALLWAALWLLAEWARGVLFTGFPWGASGYTQLESPLAVLAPWVGVYGIGAVLAGVGAGVGSGLAMVWPSPSASSSASASPREDSPQGRVPPEEPPHPARRFNVRSLAGRLGVAAVLIGGAALWPLVEFTQPTAPAHATSPSPAAALTVTLLQPAVSQDEKFAESRIPRTLAWLDQALRTARGELVVAPETAMPLLPAQRTVLAPGWWEDLQAHFEAERRVALLGAPLGSYRDGYTNSAVAMGPGTAAGYRYDKAHLVPFGEFIPFGFRWFTNLMNIPLGDFMRGPLDAPSLRVGAERIAPNICYEDLFGEELARRFRDAAQAPTILVNLSNIAWFGDTVAVPQHLNISRMRTLELQRPMLRATNTGATAVIDHRARVTAALPAFEQGVLHASVQGREGITPYAWWAGRYGLWPLVVLSLAVVVWAAAASRAHRRNGRGDAA